MVVQEPRHESLLRKQQLSAEIHGVGILFRHERSQCHDFLYRVRADCCERCREETAGLHKVNVTLAFRTDVLLQPGDFRSAFEISGINDADLDEYKIPKDAAQQTD